ncbi:MAG: hypothetical protein VYA54_01400 [Bdellovibrionota bacterium]|nr:hypothetical protein [Bdellovibrionota bacterium]
MKILILLATILVGINSHAQMYDDVKAHFRINAKDTNMLMPNKPTTVEVWFTDSQSGEVIKDYKEMHGKLMHMVLIKKDLSVFKHIHPYFEPVTGRFAITLNMPLSDPDNFHLKDALTEPGMYMLMADVEPHGYGMRMAHKMIMAHGNQVVKPLEIDPAVGNKSIKTFSQYGNDYKLELEQWNTPGCSGHLVEFMTTLYEKNNQGVFEPATDIEPWLGAGAHSVWVSENMMGHHHQMHYAHMHSKIPEEGSSHFFNFHDLKIMKPGLQKIWIQIKQKGNVLTIPVVFDYQLSTEDSNCK